MARVHLIVGPVGSGKSTFALALCREHAAVRLTLDEWMSVLFSPDRPDEGLIEWYRERARRCVEVIWRTAQGLLAAGTDVVLEIGLIQQPERVRFLERVEAAGVPVTIYVLEAPREVRWERVQRRNQERGATFSMVVPPQIFELASDLWERPDEDECRGREVRFIDTEG
jgi:predicted kinase